MTTALFCPTVSYALCSEDQPGPLLEYEPGPPTEFMPAALGESVCSGIPGSGQTVHSAHASRRVTAGLGEGEAWGCLMMF